MKKIISSFFLMGVLLFNSGFGAVENNSYVQSEIQTSENIDKQRIESLKNSDKDACVLNTIEEEASNSQSISEKLGEYLVIAVHFVFKTISNFLISLVH